MNHFLLKTLTYKLLIIALIHVDKIA